MEEVNTTEYRRPKKGRKVGCCCVVGVLRRQRRQEKKKCCKGKKANFFVGGFCLKGRGRLWARERSSVGGDRLHGLLDSHAELGDSNGLGDTVGHTDLAVELALLLGVRGGNGDDGHLHVLFED